MSIDTLAYAKELKSAGVASEAAEAHASALNKAVQGGLATKADIAGLRTETKADIAGLRLEMQAMESRFYSRMAMFMAVQAFAILALTAAIVQALK